MFYGEHEHTLDAKGRVILPSKFREPFDAGAYLTRAIDGCLAVYTPDEFALLTAGMQEKAKRGQVHRNVARLFSAGTAEVVPDRQGRIALPPKLREYARLDERVVVTGAINRLEIWDAETWSRISEESEAAMNDPTAELGDMTI